MKYRYPFTPFPKGWYRIEAEKKLIAFGRELQLEQNGDKLKLNEIKNPQRIFPLIQKNGFLFAFYDEEECHPYFDVPVITEFNDQEWQPPFSLWWKRTRVHTQEVAENALDLSHFCTVHAYHQIPVITRFQTFEHQFNVVMHSSRKLLGFISKTEMDITYHGMGIVVANVNTSNNISLKVLLTTTPIDQESVDIHMSVAIKKTKNPMKNLLLRKIIPREIRTEFSRDIPVWEAKIYRDKPLLCQVEANIIRIRKWAKQFYSESHRQ